MKKAFFKIVFGILIISMITGCGPRGNLTVAEKQQKIIDMEKVTLERLYKEAPETKDKIANAVGYGTFSNANVNLIWEVYVSIHR